MNIGIFGITGNPPHLSHWNACNIAVEYFDEVWLSPVYTHPFGKKFLPYDIRRKMILAMFKDFPIKNLKVMDFDKEYFEKHQETVYSYKLLCFLKEKYPENNFKLIIGEDNFKEETWVKFYKSKEIVDQFGVFIVKEQGFHSTEIRKMLQNNEDVVELVSSKVLQIIKKNNLYRNEL